MDSLTLTRLQSLGRFVRTPQRAEKALGGWWLVEAGGFRWWLHESGRKILSAKHWELTEGQRKGGA